MITSTSNPPTIRLLYGILFSVLIGLSLAVTYVIRPVEGPGFSFTLDPELRPGSPRPANRSCEWYAITNETITCKTTQSTGDTIVWTFDLSTSRIIHASVAIADKNISVGSLILAWGTPTGYSPMSRFGYVFWPDKYAYIQGNGPNARVYTLQWYNGQTAVNIYHWRGWVKISK